MTAVTDTTQAPSPVLQIRVPVDDLAKYAGLIGLASATLAVTGVFATTAYLSAWSVPAPVLRLDPLTAALRSDTVIYQSLVLWLVVYGLDLLLRRLPAGRKVRIPVLAVVGALLALLVYDSIAFGFYGPVITVVGGVGLLVAHHRHRLSARGTVVAFVLVALAAAYQTGAESGRLIRDDTTYQTPLVLTTRSAVGGLAGRETGFGWTYDGLYLVFRDGESIYVARPGPGHGVWIVPVSNVMSVGIADR
jgi:hypothetical protein